MAAPVHQSSLDALAAAVAEQRVHTVRVCFADHYGVLRGRRLAADNFMADVSAPQAFCDGALVWDIRCDIFEETDFSNFGTGYPDLFARPDLATLRPCGWREGEYAVLADAHDADGAPIEVDPRRVLRRVAERVPAVEVASSLELRVPDEELAAAWAPGHAPAFADELARGLQSSDLPLLAVEWDRPARVVRLVLGGTPPLQAADALVLARTAARELAGAHGVRLTAMPRLDAADPMTAMALRVALPREIAPDDVAARLEDVRLLLRPLPMAYGQTGDALARDAGAGLTVEASSDACPYLAVAAVLAAGCEESAAASAASSEGYAGSIARFRAARWTTGWFDGRFTHDALALGEREAALRAGTVTAWDLERYWDAG